MSAHARRLLVGYDGSDSAERALDTATGLMGYGSTITVLTVVDGNSIGSHVLENARKRLLGNNVAARYVEAAGDPAVQLVAFARQLEADVIVIGRQDQGTLRQLVLGSVSSQVVRRAPCDVLVVR